MAYETYGTILQTTGYYLGSFEEFQKNPPVKGRFDITGAVWIGKLPNKVDSNLIMDACEPAGYKFRPTRQFGCRYAFVRKLEGMRLSGSSNLISTRPMNGEIGRHDT
jgi:hypothetical protein